MTRRIRRKWIGALVCSAMLLSGCGSHTDTASVQTPTATRTETSQNGNLVIQESEYVRGEGDQTRAANVSKITKNVSTGEAQNRSLQKIETLQPAKEKGKTIMVYMVGSDLESDPDSRNATKDITEMLDAQMDDSDINLVVYTGGSNTWWNGLPNNQNCYLVYDGKAKDFSVFGHDNANMAAQDVLTNFLITTQEKFPAKEYSIIFWDHGGGPLQGYGHDEKFEPDNNKAINMLTIPEIKRAFDETGFGKKKFDWIGFDACLMGSLEIASQLQGYTDTMIAAPETEPGCGWDYAFLKEFKTSMEPNEEAKIIIDGYADYLEAAISARSNVRYSLINYDLTRIKGVETAVDTLFKKLNQDLKTNPQLRQQIVRAAGATWQYAYKGGFEMFDLGQFASNLPETYAAETATVNDAIIDVVDYGRTNIANTTGISFYMPVAERRMYEIFGERAVKDNPVSKELTEYIDDYVTEIWGVSREPVELDRSGSFLQEETDHKKVYKIPEELQGKLASASITIMSRSTNHEGRTSYATEMINVPVEMDETTITVDQNLPIALYSGQGSNLIPSVYVQSNNGKQYYRTDVAALSLSEDYGFTKFVPACVYYIWDPETGKTTVDSVRILKDGEVSSLSAMKSDIEGEEYKYLRVWIAWGNTLNDEEKLKPYSEKDNTSNLWRNVPFGENFAIDVVSSNDLDKTNFSWDTDFSYQLIATDLQGEEYVIAFEDVEKETENTVVKTQWGEMEFRIEEDQAVLVQYEGEDRVLEIPAEVEGKPVKWIKHLKADDVKELIIPDSVVGLEPDAYDGSGLQKVTLSKNLKEIPAGLFSTATSLESIEIPEGVESIGDFAFQDSGIKQITIPASVKHIGEGVFSGCKELETVILEKGSKFKVKDSFLFDETGTELLAYMPKSFPDDEDKTSKENGEEEQHIIGFDTSSTTVKPEIVTKTIIIPEGTERIAEGVFAGIRPEYSFDKKNVLQVVFPKGLKCIAAYAFDGARLGQDLDLPDSLEELGAFAFSNPMFPLEDDPKIGRVHLGPNIQKIGFGCFNEREDLIIELDENNKFFSLKNGKLMNLAGDTEIPAVTNPDTDGMGTS